MDVTILLTAQGGTEMIHAAQLVGLIAVPDAERFTAFGAAENFGKGGGAFGKVLFTLCRSVFIGKDGKSGLKYPLPCGDKIIGGNMANAEGEV